MGFAGQVFAARVAVGLAMPTESALKRGTGLIYKFGSSLHKRMNSQSVKAAKDRKSQAEKDFKSIEERVKNHQGKLASAIAGGQKKFKSSVAAMSMRHKTTARQSLKDYMKAQDVAGGQKTKQQIKATYQAGRQAFVDFADIVKTRAPDLHVKLFDEDALEDTTAMAMSLDDLWTVIAEGTDAERKELKEAGRLLVKQKKEQFDLAKTEIKLAEIKLKVARDTKVITGAQFRESMRGLEESKAWFQDSYNAAKAYNDVILQGLSDYNQAFKEWEQEHGEMSADMVAAKKAIEKADKDLAKAEKDLAVASHKAGIAAQQLWKELKTGFTGAIRDSISALTAFYYKLNQSTQQLIEFERELINANSVFNLTRDELYKTGEVITQFGQKFGLSMQNGAEGLYQLASAGLSANDAIKVLPETLKLSMAVQGDHNTISKLTTQTLFGFGMEADRAAEITDKFAFTIQKSLVEYEDLSSAVKFALPFFTSTGQSIDQLLGSLQILTNRALEAGIAGRGLRQALAEFAEGAEDNDRAFRKMGISILDSEGNMKQLTEIAAEFARVVGEDTINNTELLTALIQDLNVRGATAFVHLVQNADEFAEAVENTANAGGQLDEMVKIQNESISSQIQILKNNIEMLFFMRDATYEGTGALNAFHKAILDMVKSLRGALVKELEDGTSVLTDFGQQLQDIATTGVREFADMLQRAVVWMKEFTSEGGINVDLLRVYLIPMKVLLGIMEKLGPKVTKAAAAIFLLNKFMSIGRLWTIGYNAVMFIYNALVAKQAEARVVNSVAAGEEAVAVAASSLALDAETVSLVANSGAQAENAAARGVNAGAAGTTAGVGAIGAGTGLTVAGSTVGTGLTAGAAGTGTTVAGSTVGTGVTAGAAGTGTAVAGAGVGMATIAAAVLVIFVALGAIAVYFMEFNDSLDYAKDLVGGIAHGIKEWGKDLLLAYEWGTALVGVFGALGAMIAGLFVWDNWKKGIINIGLEVQAFFGIILYGLSQTGAWIDDTWWLHWSGDHSGGSGGTKSWGDLFDNIQDGFWGWVGIDGLGGVIPAASKLWDDQWWTHWDSTNPSGESWKTKLPDLGEWLVDNFNRAIAKVHILWNDFLAWIGVGTTQQEEAAADYQAQRLNKGQAMVAQGGVPGKVGEVFYGTSGEGYQFMGHQTDYSVGGAIETGQGLSHDIQNSILNPMTWSWGDEGASGGYMRGLARGGTLVGERGPEIFRPSTSGQVINNSRSRHILSNSLEGSNMPRGGMGGNMVVEKLIAAESQFNQSKIGVDTFAGVA